MAGNALIRLLILGHVVATWAEVSEDLLRRALRSRQDELFTRSNFAALARGSNAFLNAMHQALHAHGLRSEWPEFQPYHKSVELLHRFESQGLEDVLSRRARVTSMLDTQRIPLSLSLWQLESLDANKKWRLYLDPSATKFETVRQWGVQLQEWLRLFPEDLVAQFWASRVALNIGDFTTANSTMASIYSLTEASAEKVCKHRPSSPEHLRKGFPHGNMTSPVETLDPACHEAGRALKTLAEEWSDLLLLIARDGSASSEDGAQLLSEAFAIRSMASLAKDALQDFWGPSAAFRHPAQITATGTKFMTLSGLRHHRDQLKHLAEILQQFCDNNRSSDADVATAASLLNKLGEPCKASVEILRGIVQRFHYASMRAIETNTVLVPESLDAILLPADAAEQVLPFLERHIHLDPAGEALPTALSAPPGSEKWREAEQGYKKGQVLVVDDVFSQEALENLRLFSERSTVFHTWQPSGYLCGFWSDGFAPPLFAQVFAELQKALPSVLCNHRLVNAWAYKYDDQPDVTHPSNGTGIHTDGAAVNVNCWIVPDSSLADNQYGGMKVWRTTGVDADGSNYNMPGTALFELADNGSFIVRYQEFEQMSSKIAQLEQDKPVVVPYKQNRCVIFDSSLWHATNKVRSKPGFTNRRINLTFLAGVIGDTCKAVKKRSKQGKLASQLIQRISSKPDL